MGANAQTTVPTFTAGEVLTADQQNNSARTGVPVFATTTTRDAAFGGTGEKTLAEGQLCYLESTNVVQYYDGSTWATVGPTTVSSALTYITGAALATNVTTQAFTNVFSATYDNYMIVGSDLCANATTGTVKVTLGATATNYYYAGTGRTSGGTALNPDSAGSTTFWYVGNFSNSTARGAGFVCYMYNPYNTKMTSFNALSNNYDGTAPYILHMGGILNNTTSYTDFTITQGDNANFTAGTVRIYGIANS